jgi:hypothetical protein
MLFGSDGISVVCVVFDALWHAEHGERMGWR